MAFIDVMQDWLYLNSKSLSQVSGFGLSQFKKLIQA